MVLKVVVLGSGGTLPSRFRSLPALVIQREGSLCLFDCGEGCQLQFMKSKLNINKLEHIFISHLHGDHVTGLPGLIMSLNQMSHIQPLHIHGPPGIADYVAMTQRCLGFHCHYPLEVTEQESGIVYEEASFTVRSVVADHSCLNLAYAFEEKPRPGRFLLDNARCLGVPEGPLFHRLQQGESVTLPNGKVVHPQQVLGPPRRGRKVTYATDTRPSAAVEKLARHSDLLLHDGMLAADLADQAHLKGHSTAEEAARVAGRARVHRLLLIHISSRYFDDSMLEKQARHVFQSTWIARDFMEVEIPLPK